MNEKLTTSNFTYSGSQVRITGTPDDPLFVAADVCKVLGIANTADALNRLDDDEKGIVSIYTPSEVPMWTVTAPGLYSLILGSRKPEARAFKRWVTHEVLPSIQRTGKYQTGPTVLALPQTYAEALRALADTVEEKEKLALTVATMEPKAAFFDAVTDSKDAIEMATVAKVLAVPGYGRTKLFAFLREKKILRRNNMPYQEFIDRGYFRVIEQKWQNANGETHVTCKTLVFQKGIDYIRLRLAP